MGHIDTTRSVRNTSYIEQIKPVTVDNLNEYLCEEGALIKMGEQILVGINGEWVKIAPIIGVEDYQFQRVSDGQYNDQNMFNFGQNQEYVFPNDSTNDFDHNGKFYKGQSKIFSLQQNSNYILKISFRGHLNTSNGHMEIYFEDNDGNLFDESADVLTFPKGNGIEHRYSRTFYFTCQSDAAMIQAKFRSSHSGSLYSVQYEIQKVLQYV